MSNRDRRRTSTTKPDKRRGGRDKSYSTARQDLLNRRKELTKFYGVQACLAIFERRRHDIARVFVAPELEDAFREVSRWCRQQRIPFKVGDYAELSKVAGTEHHEGACIEAKPRECVSLESVLKKSRDFSNRIVLVLEGVDNPHNIGAILRTACFFGATSVVIASDRVATLSGATCRVAEGAAEIVPVVISPDVTGIIKTLRAEGFQIVATTPHEAQSVYGKRWPKHVAILFGSEGTGLTKDLIEAADERVVVPRIGALESLNVGAAVSSVLTEARRDLMMTREKAALIDATYAPRGKSRRSFS